MAQLIKKLCPIIIFKLAFLFVVLFLIEVAAARVPNWSFEHHHQHGRVLLGGDCGDVPEGGNYHCHPGRGR
ncbi:hypothetical protein HN51_060588 [Arachis hypogaea]